MSKDPSRFEKERRVASLKKQLERGSIKEIPDTWVGKLLLKELNQNRNKGKGFKR